MSPSSCSGTGEARLASWFGQPGEAPVGEAWLPVHEGCYAGRPFIEVLRRLGPDFLGPRGAAAFPRLPLLVKMIEA